MAKLFWASCILFFLLFAIALFNGAAVSAHPAPGPVLSSVSHAVTGAPDRSSCGDKILPEDYYEQASLIALIACFTLVFIAILVDKKQVKLTCFGLAIFPIAAWLYVHFFIDYASIKKQRFSYNAQAENTLANIAEAQDRYKSEHDTFVKDLNKLYSHMAGPHGANECVKIIKIEAEWNSWQAEARHVSSPDKITWDSRRGSSLKKG
jgi:hypothetical protein